MPCRKTSGDSSFDPDTKAGKCGIFGSRKEGRSPEIYPEVAQCEAVGFVRQQGIATQRKCEREGRADARDSPRLRLE